MSRHFRIEYKIWSLDFIVLNRLFYALTWTVTSIAGSYFLHISNATTASSGRRWIVALPCSCFGTIATHCSTFRIWSPTSPLTISYNEIIGEDNKKIVDRV